MNTRTRRSVRSASKGAKPSKALGERNRAPSLRDVYVKRCAECGIHPNSGIVGILPDKSGAAFPQDALDISRNYLGDKGIVPLLAAVDRMTNLRALVVTENGLRNKGIDAICAAAIKHPSLEYLDVSENFISDGAAQSLEKLLLTNPRMVEVVFEATKIDVEWRVRLKDLIVANRNGGNVASLGATADHSG